MGGQPVPKTPFIASLEHVKHDGGRRWRSQEGRLFEWDALHGELEVYNSRGRHLGAVDPATGVLIKGAVQGRKIDV